MTDMERRLRGLPKEMGEGSFGDVPTKVNIFLAGFFEPGDDFQADETYGPIAVARMKDFQRKVHITPTGSCDTDTRAAMKKYGFDFDFVASRSGKSTFVRSDGSHLEWWPETRP